MVLNAINAVRLFLETTYTCTTHSKTIYVDLCNGLANGVIIQRRKSRTCIKYSIENRTTMLEEEKHCINALNDSKNANVITHDDPSPALYNRTSSHFSTTSNI